MPFFAVLYTLGLRLHWVSVLGEPVQGLLQACAFGRGSVRVLSWIAVCPSLLHIIVCLTPSVDSSSMRKANARIHTGFPESTKQGTLCPVRAQ